VSEGLDVVVVAMKLKYHRLKPVVSEGLDVVVVGKKLKDHRLKPVVSGQNGLTLCSCEVEVPPAEAGGVESIW
jgi:hypothetical protein